MDAVAPVAVADLPAGVMDGAGVFGGGVCSAVRGVCFGARRRRLLRLRAQILADLVALDLVFER